MELLPPLSKRYQSFRTDHLPTLSHITSLYDEKVGNDFIDFLLRMLPDVPPNHTKVHVKDLLPENFIEKLWDHQATWWANAETFATYFTDICILDQWFKRTESKKNILSIGCGPGLYELFIEQAISNTFDHFYTTDFSPSMIQEAKRNQKKSNKLYSRNSRLEYKVCDMKSLPFPDKSMDIVFSNKALHWSLKKRDAIMEMSRVLKPGGACMLIVPKGKASITFKGGGGIPFASEEINPVTLGGFMTTELGFGVMDFLNISLPPGFGQGGGALEDFGLFVKKNF
jgi:ubiquinone/menaquinone biosynthesis C-methylase UbiE